MKLLTFLVLGLSFLACSKLDDETVKVTSLDQLTGEWQLVSTCGGLIEACEFTSSAHYAFLNFTSDSAFTEKRNDTLYERVNFTLIKINESSGTLSYKGTKYERPVSIVKNQLEIVRGELVDTYKKIK